MTVSHLIKTAPSPISGRLNIVEGIDGWGGESTQEWNFFDLVNGTTRRGETSNRRPEIDLGGIWMLTDPRFVCYLRIDVETLTPASLKRLP